ncbi:MAG TPA: S8/S53 family peptidase [Kineosporiaceae bacterium]|nr:S8/S53 family peptidase [Kineosporiaceae bacterium]
MTDWIGDIGRRNLLVAGGLGVVAGALGGRTPAIAARAGLSEHRTAAQLESDQQHARRQVAALSSARGRGDSIIAGMRARQERAPHGAAVLFDHHRAADVLLARGELIVRTPSSSTARLRAVGYQATARPAVFRSGKPIAELLADVATLRAQGIDAGPNLVVPLGHIVKGDDIPVVTTGLGAAGSTGTPAVTARVALIDTGITAQTRTDGWLAGVARGPAAVDPLDVVTPLDRLDWGSGHGTFTAGIVQRVAPGCEIVAYRFSGADGLGTDQDVADALVQAAREGSEAGRPTIINASLGTAAIGGVPPLAMQAAVELITSTYPDVLIIASAGNLGSTEPVYPAAFDRVVAVGALTDDLQPAPFSSHGDWVSCSSVGVGVVSTFVSGVEPPESRPDQADQEFGANPWALWSGTSFSAPQISGAVARLCGEAPGLRPRAALDMLLAGKPSLPGYGSTVRLLPGTPIG